MEAGALFLQISLGEHLGYAVGHTRRQAARIAAMELHTRDAKDEIALAQLGAAVILLWHKVPKFMQADLLYVAETIQGVPNSPRCAPAVAASH